MITAPFPRSASRIALELLEAFNYENRLVDRQSLLDQQFYIRNSYIEIDEVKLSAIDGLSSILEIESAQQVIQITDRVKTTLTFNQYEAFQSKVDLLLGKTKTRFSFRLNKPQLRDRAVIINVESLVIGEQISIDGFVRTIDEKVIAIVEKVISDETTISHLATHSFLNYPENRVTSSLLLYEDSWRNIKVDYRARPFCLNDIKSLLDESDENSALNRAIDEAIERLELEIDQRTYSEVGAAENSKIKRSNEAIRRQIKALERRRGNIT